MSGEAEEVTHEPKNAIVRYFRHYLIIRICRIAEVNRQRIGAYVG